jgi:hypothetical protein
MKFIEDYATKRERVRRFTKEAAELRQHPGKWGVLVESAPNRWTAKHVSTGQLVDFAPRGTFQGSARQNDDGTFTILARFLGNARTQRRSDSTYVPPAPKVPLVPELPTSPAFVVPDELRDAPDFTTDAKYSKDSKLTKAVRKEQGGWAVIYRGQETTLVARDITKNRSSLFPAAEYEAQAVRDPRTNLFTIYARYIGQDA